MSNQDRDTYKYHFKVHGLIVHRGITNNLQKRENEHRNSGRYTNYNLQRFYWIDGHIVQVGNITTKEAALEWEREQHDFYGGD
jgi:hypothetical protein